MSIIIILQRSFFLYFEEICHFHHIVIPLLKAGLPRVNAFYINDAHIFILSFFCLFFFGSEPVQHRWNYIFEDINAGLFANFSLAYHLHNRLSKVVNFVLVLAEIQSTRVLNFTRLFRTFHQSIWRLKHTADDVIVGG